MDTAFVLKKLRKIKDKKYEDDIDMAIRRLEAMEFYYNGMKKERDIWRKHSNYFEHKIYKMIHKMRKVVEDACKSGGRR
jgi:hypothetical protein